MTRFIVIHIHVISVFVVVVAASVLIVIVNILPSLIWLLICLFARCCWRLGFRLRFAFRPMFIPRVFRLLLFVLVFIVVIVKFSTLSGLIVDLRVRPTIQDWVRTRHWFHFCLSWSRFIFDRFYFDCGLFRRANRRRWCWRRRRSRFSLLDRRLFFRVVASCWGRRGTRCGAWDWLSSGLRDRFRRRFGPQTEVVVFVLFVECRVGVDYYPEELLLVEVFLWVVVGCCCRCVASRLSFFNHYISIMLLYL